MTADNGYGDNGNIRSLETVSPRLLKDLPVGHKQILGKNGEVNVCSLLRRQGRDARRANGGPFDLLVDGWKLDVKTARPSFTQGNGAVPTWLFRLHSNYKMREHETDFYVFRFEDVPYFDQPIHCLIKSPIGKLTVSISMRQLVIQWAIYANDFLRFRNGEFGIKPQVHLEASDAR